MSCKQVCWENRAGDLTLGCLPTQYGLFFSLQFLFWHHTEPRDTLNLGCILLSIRDIFEHNFMDFVFQNTENMLN